MEPEGRISSFQAWPLEFLYHGTVRTPYAVGVVVNTRVLLGKRLELARISPSNMSALSSRDVLPKFSVAVRRKLNVKIINQPSDQNCILNLATLHYYEAQQDHSLET